EFRTAVYLADIEGYPYREIAEIMGTPVGTVMSRLHRGRRKIREQLLASGLGTAKALGTAKGLGAAKGLSAATGLGAPPAQPSGA
ncbi:MAG TPA: sigma factor-like helix-turn-helix DNA-binding protein, partial [Streptosporangiaceae bacterium]|nr:sigma factor-like helix-turn-helix DNA-binding protein [Streptosporangiaceae bacterium]